MNRPNAMSLRMRKSRQPRGRTRRRGSLTLELLLVLPILLVMLVGLLEFSLLFYARGDVVEASRAGVRMATYPGVDESAVRNEVARTLSPRLRSRARVETQLSEYPGEEVRVVVRVPMTAAAPDLLWMIGYSIRNRDLVSESRMLRE